MKKVIALFLALTMCLGMVACSSSTTEKSQSSQAQASSSSEATERTIVDMAGDEVTIPAEINTVFNGWPSSNQIMMTLGVQDKQIAYMKTLQQPNFKWMQIVNPAIMEKDGIGEGQTGVTAEELVELNPDLVITANGDGAAEYREAGLNAICLMFTNYDQLKQSISIMGEIFGGEAQKRAEEYIDYLDGNIKLVQDRLKDVKDEDKPTVYYMDGQSGKDPYVTSGTGTIQEEWITIAGGKLATDGVLEGMSQEITPEQLLKINPDYILVGGLGQANCYNQLMEDESLSTLKALKEDKVYRIPQGTFQWCRFGSETALQVVWTAKTLYPDKFEDIDMKEMTKEFYKKFLDYDLSDEYAEAILAGKNAPDGE
ncbi:MAG: ABC transporter substrate-binding protein [Intestinibacter sp.]|uniref:ABC transporter substrate-binding protein n=1 Tax=Intestinibacter sp. TaxID=1965304 RepID=UPI003F140004